MGDTGAGRAAEQAARSSYGRLLAYLARRWRDIAAAEDALGDAFARALIVWPAGGVPKNPEAWLLVAARNRLRDAAKALKVRGEAVESLLAMVDEAMPDKVVIPDKRLELMFVCAHPEIDAAIRTPLMLQTVLGLDAARIASSFLVSPAAMGQRLSRAKARIAEAGIRFMPPEAGDLADRAAAVREAIFAAYGAGWDNLSSADLPRNGLTTEAIWLARVFNEVLRDDPEALGLLSLMLFCEARRAARLVDGVYVPLSDQDTALWDREMLEEAEAILSTASRLGRPGRFQIEAAIQSAHVAVRRHGLDLRRDIATLHEGLVAHAPTIGNHVGLAAALAETRGASSGLAILDKIAPKNVLSYQPYWAVRAHLLTLDGGALDDIVAAYENAIGLCADPPMRDHLQRKRDCAITNRLN